jgi:hypothetical protein
MNKPSPSIARTAWFLQFRTSETCTFDPAVLKFRASGTGSEILAMTSRSCPFEDLFD